MTRRSVLSVALMCVALVIEPPVIASRLSGRRSEPSRRRSKPLRALTTAAAASTIDELQAIFGADGQELFASSDPATARRNREVFTVAIAEGWRLQDLGTNRKTLIVGNENWPFPVPLVKSGSYWRFDTAAGKEEVLARRIGRNELAVIATCRAYVKAQHRYAETGTRWTNPRVCSRRRSAAIRASRTDCTGPPSAVNPGARLATWWRRRRRKDGTIGTAPSARRHSMATTSRC